MTREDESPIAGATIRLLDRSARALIATTSSDAEGWFDATERPFYEVLACVSATGRGTIASFGRYGSARDVFRLPLVRRIVGRVVDDAGAPVAGAIVGIDWIETGADLGMAPVTSERRSDAAGRFELDDVPAAGACVVFARDARGLVGRSRAIALAVDSGEPLRCDVELPWLAEIRGRLVVEDGRSLHGVTVYVESAGFSLFPCKQKVRCDAAGRFRMEAATAGGWSFEVVEHDARLYGEAEISFAQGDSPPEVEIELGPHRYGPPDPLDPEPEPGRSSICGSVEGLRPYPDADAREPRTLVLLGGPARVVEIAPERTGTRFRFEGIPAGRYAVWLFDRENDGSRRLAAVEVGPDERVDLGTIELKPAARIRGRVRTATGAPAAEAEVYLVALDGPLPEWSTTEGALRAVGYGKADDDGRFDLAPHDGAVAIEAWPRYEPPAIAWLEGHAPGEPIELAPVRGSTVRGRLIDPRGFPIPGLAVSAVVKSLARGVRPFGDGCIAWDHTDPLGTFELRGVPSGTLTIHVIRGNFGSALRPFEILVDEPVEELPDIVVR